jgi:uncharacterized protein with ParB-like and HNH nuclease domain
MDFSIKNNQTVSLSLLKKESASDELLFNLVDENQQIWVTLELRNNELILTQKSEEIVYADDIFDFKLEEILAKIVETEKSGMDNYSEVSTLEPDIADSERSASEPNPYDPDQIKVRSDKISITLISQMIDNGDIDLNPDFQRHLVWDQRQKSLLIESILLRIPLPMFYFAEDREGKLSVVDGLQRISTIKEFMDNKFSLKNLQYLKENCGGKYYTTKGNKQGIDTKYFRWFNLTTLSANIIDPSSPFKVKYDVFRRINTGGKPLNNQEIRNCLTGQGLRQVLKKMASLMDFKTATDGSIKPSRMDDQELALRFLMFYKMRTSTGNIDSYNGYMDFSLDEFTEAHIKSNPDDFEQSVESFSCAMKNAEYLFGKKYSFRKITLKDATENAHKQLINKALFVCTSILLADYSHEKIKELNNRQALLRPLASEIERDQQLFSYLSYGTNGKTNLLYAYEKLEKLFNATIKY